jgi:hypothetical protein
LKLEGGKSEVGGIFTGYWGGSAGNMVGGKSRGCSLVRRGLAQKLEVLSHLVPEPDRIRDFFALGGADSGPDLNPISRIEVPDNQMLDEEK